MNLMIGGASLAPPTGKKWDDEKILLIFEYLKQLEKIKHDDLEFKERKKIGFRRKEEH